MKLKYIIIAFLTMCTVFSYGQLHIEGVFFIGEDAEVHVWNDLEIATATGELSLEGVLEIEGDFERSGDASFIGNPNGVGRRSVLVRNNNFNINNSQRITGDMTGDNAFFRVLIDNAPDGMVELDGNIEIQERLHFTDGRIRTDVMSHTDGNNYANEVFVSNSDPGSLSGYSISSNGSSDRFIEGKLRRAVEDMGTNYDFPIGLTQGSEPFQINFSTPVASSIIGVLQTNTTTATGLTQLCDVGTGGANPDPFMPDGTLDNLTIDCVTGQWLITSDDNMTPEYDITFFPSSNLLDDCPDALYYFVGQDGSLEDCPDINRFDGVTRNGLVGFSDTNFDIATASSMSSVFTSVEVIPSTDRRVSLFPNPVNGDFVNVKLEGNVFSAGEGIIEIYNSIGQVFYSEKINLFGNNQTIQIPISSQIPGLHHFVIRNEFQMTSRPFMVVE